MVIEHMLFLNFVTSDQFPRVTFRYGKFVYSYFSELKNNI